MDTGWEWRLPTEEEIEALVSIEEHYTRKPVQVSVEKFHPFFGKYKKSPWTLTKRKNVSDSENALAPGGVFNANASDAGYSGIAQMLGVASGQVASEARSIGREFLIRFVREYRER